MGRVLKYNTMGSSKIQHRWESSKIHGETLQHHGEIQHRWESSKIQHHGESSKL